MTISVLGTRLLRGKCGGGKRMKRAIIRPFQTASVFSSSSVVSLTAAAVVGRNNHNHNHNHHVGEVFSSSSYWNHDGSRSSAGLVVAMAAAVLLGGEMSYCEAPAPAPKGGTDASTSSWWRRGILAKKNNNGVNTNAGVNANESVVADIGAPIKLQPTFGKEVTGPKGIPSRTEQMQALRASTKASPFDVLVIGGGATGCGIAFDAATRVLDDTHKTQLRVACIERGDFASETSSRSTKLVWAGIKYLATASAGLLSLNLFTSPLQTIHDFKGEFNMVYNCHKERRYMTTQNEHLTNWIPIVVPFTEWHIWPPPFGHWLFSFFPILAPAVFKFYDGLSSFTCPPSYIMGKKKAHDLFPQLNEKQLKYAAVFYEAQHNDARTCIAIAMTAAEKGANIANYVEMTGTIHDDHNKVIGIQALDRIKNESFQIYAKNVVFAGGPFTDGLRKMEHSNKKKTTEEKDGGMKQAVRGGSGSHIVLPGYYCPGGMGLLDYNTSDGRFLFFLPWQNHTLVGTTDRKIPAETLPTPPEAEIQWILKECEKYLSKDLKVRRSDVLSSWRGWRPLAVDPNAKPGAPASRDHVISVNPDTGITFIAGGKWTTWREMAQDVIDRVLKDKSGTCTTLDIKLHGGDGYTTSLPIQLIQQHGMSKETAEHLANTYGTRAWEVCEYSKPTNKRWPRFGVELTPLYPYIEAEVVFACKEYACTIEDVLSRRTRLAFLNKDAAISVIPRVAEIMAEELGWTAKVTKEQILAAEHYLNSYGGRIPVNEKETLRAHTYEDIMDIFKAIDTDGSGYLDTNEVREISIRLGFPLSDTQMKEAFEEMDADHNGKVTTEEFIAWWNHSKNDTLRNKIANELRLGGTKPEQLKEMGTGSLLG